MTAVLENISLGTQERVQIAVINEPSVFEPSKFQCTFEQIEKYLKIARVNPSIYSESGNVML